jgi:hypothetical protein
LEIGGCRVIELSEQEQEQAWVAPMIKLSAIAVKISQKYLSRLYQYQQMLALQQCLFLLMLLMAPSRL